MRGEQVVAAEYLWRLNDSFYGQWSMMRVPFRSLAKFQIAAVRAKVPDRYRWLATAVLLTDGAAGEVPEEIRGFWRDPARIAAELRLEGRPDAVVQDVLAFVAAHVVAIDRYLSGQLDRREEEQGGARGPRAAAAAPATEQFEGKQSLFHRAVAQRVALARRAQGAVAEAEADRLRAEAAARKHQPVVCSGRPGTGKTTVVHCNVRETLAGGGSVLVALPTARLATRMAARLGDHESLVVDTFTAAFQLHKPEQEGLYAMYGYDLVVVDEFSQLSRADFERILRLWRAADCLPALVFLGDKYQLPGVDPQRAWESAAWSSSNLYFLELTQVFRCDDPAFLETLQLLRTAVPTKTQLNKICRGHKAWTGDKPDADASRETNASTMSYAVSIRPGRSERAHSDIVDAVRQRAVAEHTFFTPQGFSR